MAIYSFHVDLLSRKRGNAVNAVLRAAYRAGVKLRRLPCTEDGEEETYDYSRRQGVIHAEILAPETAPTWVQDRERLWNEVENKEKRCDAQVAREILVALPCELSSEDQIALVRRYVQQEFVDAGMVADISIHCPKKGSDARNFHAYILLTTRNITPSGFADKKCRQWNSSVLLNRWRAQWATCVNQALEAAGSSALIDHRTLIAQGITDRATTTHQGKEIQKSEVDVEIQEQSALIEEEKPILAKVGDIRVSVMFTVGKRQKPIWQQFPLDVFDWDNFAQGMTVELVPQRGRNGKVKYQVRRTAS